MKSASRILLLVCLFLLVAWSSKAQDLLTRIQQLPGIISVEKMNPNSFFKNAWIIMVKQPIDHKHPERGTFPQRVVLSHLDLDRPVVLITEGYGGDYGATPRYLNELCPLLRANQLFVEHRYFGKSVPDSINWNDLTVENAAADHHHVIELFRTIYTQKWISTGISKGGETVLYHRALYPADVAISVPYVAPLNYSTEEHRHDQFIRHHVGTAQDRKRIDAFQREVLKRKDQLIPLFDQYTNDKGFHYRADNREIFDYCVLEFAFSFWQWGRSTKEIPADTVSNQELFNYFMKVCSSSYFDVESGKPTFPFFVQALKQLGYYGYNPKPFGKLMELKDTHHYINHLFMPQAATFDYNPAMSLLVKDYLRKRANHVLMIYGGNDPWTASSARSYGNRSVIKIIQPGGSHRTRIGTLPEAKRKEVSQILDRWLAEPSLN